MIRRSPLSLELMAAAAAVHSLEPFRRALLAHALVSDQALIAIATVNLGADAGALRDLMLDEGALAVARLCGLRRSAEFHPTTCHPKTLDFAAAVDAVTLRELAEAGTVEQLLRGAQPSAVARRIRRRERQREEQRDVLPPSREAVA